MDDINSKSLEHYFTLLEENNIKNSPQRIYNVDEGGVPLDPKGLNIVRSTGSSGVARGGMVGHFPDCHSSLPHHQDTVSI